MLEFFMVLHKLIIRGENESENVQVGLELCCLQVEFSRNVNGLLFENY